MDKKTAVSFFNEQCIVPIKEIEKKTGGRDMPMRRQAWNDYCDMLYKDGQITNKQRMNWDQPLSCK